MSTIPNPGSEVRHVRKTIAFDGTSGKGKLGEAPVAIFSQTGRVMLERIVAYCSEALVSADAGNTMVSIFDGFNGSAFFGDLAANDFSAGYFFAPTNESAQIVGPYDGNSRAEGEIVYASRSWGYVAIKQSPTIRIRSASGIAFTAGSDLKDGSAVGGTSINSFGVNSAANADTVGTYTFSSSGSPSLTVSKDGGANETITLDNPSDTIIFPVHDLIVYLNGAETPANIVSAFAGHTMTIAFVDGANITDGTLIIDAWYRPITDDGALAGDDIDEPMRDHFWAKALSDIASVPAMTASALSGLNWLFALARNKVTQTASTQTLKKDDGTTTVGTSTVSDDGSTFTRGEWS